MFMLLSIKTKTRPIMLAIISLLSSLSIVSSLRTLRMESSLSGKVAVVTGASRGIGKGIALELGAAGATVYVCGRSTRAGGMSKERALGSDYDLTVDATCEEINQSGGLGIPVQFDATSDSEVAALFQRVRAEQGRLDVLVCSAFTTPPTLNEAKFRDDFWKQGVAMWDACHEVFDRMSCWTSVIFRPEAFSIFC
jgi:NAD(P)-dependent dehydrogenase (short-subunit alcohol dehydrogenase family)